MKTELNPTGHNFIFNNIPDGWREIKGTIHIDETNGLLVITGNPSHENEENHNCDFMVCGSLDHVILRAKITRQGL